jgi:hypothetical protein
MLKMKPLNYQNNQKRTLPYITFPHGFFIHLNFVKLTERVNKTSYLVFCTKQSHMLATWLDKKKALCIKGK